MMNLNEHSLDYNTKKQQWERERDAGGYLWDLWNTGSFCFFNPVWTRAGARTHTHAHTLQLFQYFAAMWNNEMCFCTTV